MRARGEGARLLFDRGERGYGTRKERFCRMMVLGGIVVITSVFFSLHLIGVFGERVVFEQSYQYKEARESEIATYKAQLVEIERKLMGRLLISA